VTPAREQMIAVVSHDLKNPLANIQIGVSFLLEEVVPDDADHQIELEQLRATSRSADRIYRLIHDLLDVAALEAGELALARPPWQPTYS
jgi:signal transduction histidine kinase